MAFSKYLVSGKSSHRTRVRMHVSYVRIQHIRYMGQVPSERGAKVYSPVLLKRHLHLSKFNMGLQKNLRCSKPRGRPKPGRGGF